MYSRMGIDVDQVGYNHLFRSVAGSLKRLDDISDSLKHKHLTLTSEKIKNEVKFLKRILDEIHLESNPHMPSKED